MDERIAYIGDIFRGDNVKVYLDHFETMKAKGTVVSWHWPAFLVPLYWFAYRKLYLWAVLTEVANLTVSLLGGVIIGIVSPDLYSEVMYSSILLEVGITLPVRVAAGLLVYYIYMRRIDKLTAEGRGMNNEEKTAHIKKGGTSGIALAIAIVAAGVLNFIVNSI